MNHDPALLVGRILASIIFILSGWGKAMAMAGTVGYLGSKGVPMPGIAYFVVVAVELGGGLLFLLGFQTRLMALILALWCVATALIGHIDFAAPGNVINFEKNLSMAGGFLAFVAAGGGAFSLDRMLNRRAVAV
jgi:putative oxidoreductase